MDLANEYYGEGGYDRETWHQICDGLSREAMGLMMMLAGPAHPYMAKDCERAVREIGGYHAARGRDARGASAAGLQGAADVRAHRRTAPHGRARGVAGRAARDG